MKRLIIGLISLVALLSAAGCDVIGYGKMWDIAPVEVKMEVVDAEGNNLFDEGFQNNWLSKEITASFEGETYSFPPAPGTRAYMAIMSGLTVQIYGAWENNPRPVLVFGELSGETERDSDLSILWPDGSEDVIGIKHTFHWDILGNPQGKTTLTLNGETVSNPVRLVKSSR